jgi:4-amino-4-deoxy-L-arabinose transferase-like glycosyltransferase
MPTLGHVPYRAALVACAALALAVACIILLYRLADPVIEQFDEARVANNALEMWLSGPSVVTTYRGEIDHFNTKPPLLVWLVSGAVAIVGPTEFAVRITSALASVLVAAIVFAVPAVRLRRPVAGLAAVAALFANSGYYLFHGARSGDYDALLTLWTTAYLIAAFAYLESRGPRRRVWLTIAVVAVIGAFMAKSVQGLLFLPAVPLYAALRGRLVAEIRTRDAWIAVSVVVLGVVGWFVLRELAAPGYVSAALRNDIIERGLTAAEGHVGGPLFYVLHPQSRLILAGLLVSALVALRGGPPQQLATFVALSGATYLVVISLAATKTAWYLLPVMPLGALGFGLGLHALMATVEGRYPTLSTPLRGAAAAGAIALTVAVIVRGVGFIDERVDELAANSSYAYGKFLRGPVADATPRDLVVLHPGFGQATPYWAAAQFYATALTARGFTITIQFPSDPLPAGTQHLVACDETRDALIASGSVGEAPLESDGRCGVYVLK